MEVVADCDFSSAAELIEDFWREVNLLTGYPTGL